VCGRYSVLSEDDVIAVREIIREVSLELARDELGDYTKEERTEVFPTNHAPVVTSNGDELAFEYAQFGFTKWDGKGVIINARSETIQEKSMFKTHITSGRCVIPAWEYYEWKNTGREKNKYLIKDQDGNLLFFAGLYREAAEGREFVVITKDACGDVTGIHDRMPVVLRADQIESWLNGKLAPYNIMKMDFNALVVPCDEYVQISLF
jgi:putative SOS response-associated peptidase YedK